LKNKNYELTDKERTHVLRWACNSFEALEREQYEVNLNEVYNLVVPLKHSKVRRLVSKVLFNLEKAREAKPTSSAPKISSNTSSTKAMPESSFKNCKKLGLFKIAEDDWQNECDNSEDEDKEIGRLKIKRTDLEKRMRNLEEFSSREKMNGVSSKLSSKGDSIARGKITNYNLPRGRDLLFSYNTQYGGGFGNFKNTKFAQYHQAYSRIKDKKEICKQTASSLQRIEQSHQFDQIQNCNKIISNFSKNEFSTSVYDIETSDGWMGKKKSSAMEVMEFAKIFRNKGEDSPNYGGGLSAELFNGRKTNCIPSTGNNLEYRDLKNFNWIKEQFNSDSKFAQRPWTRGGEKRGMDFSFIETKNTNHLDLIEEGSYLDRPVTRSKPRRPVSRQVRLNKRVHNVRAVRGDSESYRGQGDLGDWDPPTLNKIMNVHKIQKVIPENSTQKPIQDSISPIKIINKESFLDRKRSLRDSTSLDPNLKVNKSINFNRKNSNEVAKNNTKNRLENNSSSTKHYVVSELNRSIESIQMKDKVDVSAKFQNFKNIDKLKGKISIFKDANVVRILKKGKDYKNWYSPSIPKNNINELYSIQEEKEIIWEKKPVGIFDSFVSTTQDTKDNKGDDKLYNKERKFNRHEDLININKPQLESFITKNMKRTDGFIAFKPSIGGNSSNSLLPSSSGDTLINGNELIQTWYQEPKLMSWEHFSDNPHQTTSTNSDVAKGGKWKQFKRMQNKVKGSKHSTNEIKAKYKSRNKNQVICSKNTEPGVGAGSQHSSSSYLGFKTLYTTNFV
jgi:hypothetical protein